VQTIDDYNREKLLGSSASANKNNKNEKIKQAKMDVKEVIKKT